MAAAAVATFVFSWFFRFNDPNGGFAGLTDDHFFYLLRGWQILYGELPVRDFVDHGAPLYFYVSAAVQLIFGRGTLSELAFSTTMIAMAAAMTCWLAARASGSVLLGLLGAAFQIVLLPRFYNYPKLLVYTAAIPLLWWLVDRPGRKPVFWLAALTVIGFLFRHDHGMFVALATAAMILMLPKVRWTARRHYGLTYAVLVIVLAAPYLLFIQFNGGIDTYIRQARAWSEEERDRTPVQWPGLFDNPGGVSDEAREGPALQRAVALARDNQVAWTYDLELALPFFALVVLALSTDAFRPAWPNAAPKIAVVALLALILNAGFLRSPLQARLADPSVPHAILIAWLSMAVPRLLVARTSWRPSLTAFVPLRIAVAAGALVVTGLVWLVISTGLYDRLENAYLVDGPRTALARARTVAQSARDEWNLATWEIRPDRSGHMTLAMYLNACTAPDDRIFMAPYMPQVLGMARRGFAAGFGDLRPGFFEEPEWQAMAMRRMRDQNIPVVLLDVDDSLQNFRTSFPALAAYFDSTYEVAGDHIFDDRFGVTLLVRRDALRTGTYKALGWPCLA